MWQQLMVQPYSAFMSVLGKDKDQHLATDPYNVQEIPSEFRAEISRILTDHIFTG